MRGEVRLSLCVTKTHEGHYQTGKAKKIGEIKAWVYRPVGRIISNEVQHVFHMTWWSLTVI